jgi:putative flavoprotein involved in K+ transport
VEDGRALDIANVVWCTGYHPGFSWVELPVFDANGEPLQDRGVARGEPGLYFVGLHFLYAMSSAMIHGVGRDADYVAGVIAERSRSTPAVPARVAAIA